ncbi:MAG TPA: hypothetical protein EYM65_08410 [Dehalococcoidia bacterium]|nr:hypothetical protein [Dehalococcoidia bacterium]
MDFSENTRRCIQMLVQGDIGQVRELASTALADVQVRRQSIEVEEQVLREIVAQLPEEGPAGNDIRPDIVPAMTLAEQHIATRRIGVAVASAHPQRYASTETVEAEFISQGLVSPSRTAIGNVLVRLIDTWERVGPGVYRMKEQPNGVAPVVVEREGVEMVPVAIE